jgi:hypothetical protein
VIGTLVGEAAIKADRSAGSLVRISSPPADRAQDHEGVDDVGLSGLTEQDARGPGHHFLVDSMRHAASTVAKRA